ncbi:MAG: hypothetical protein L0196_06555 [candidate division Zixibacteria bacterium]|nr:hypothetical protein [candidate division Zixibacteria bacterium]
MNDLDTILEEAMDSLKLVMDQYPSVVEKSNQLSRITEQTLLTHFLICLYQSIGMTSITDWLQQAYINLPYDERTSTKSQDSKERLKLDLLVEKDDKFSGLAVEAKCFRITGKGTVTKVENVGKLLMDMWRLSVAKEIPKNRYVLVAFDALGWKKYLAVKERKWLEDLFGQQTPSKIHFEEDYLKEERSSVKKLWGKKQEAFSSFSVVLKSHRVAEKRWTIFLIQIL